MVIRVHSAVMYYRHGTQFIRVTALGKKLFLSLLVWALL